MASHVFDQAEPGIEFPTSEQPLFAGNALSYQRTTQRGRRFPWLLVGVAVTVVGIGAALSLTHHRTAYQIGGADPSAQVAAPVAAPATAPEAAQLAPTPAPAVSRVNATNAASAATVSAEQARQASQTAHKAERVAVHRAAVAQAAPVRHATPSPSYAPAPRESVAIAPSPVTTPAPAPQN